MTNKDDDYRKELKKTLSICQLQEGESYYYLTKTDGFIFMGKLLKKQSEVKRIHWHEGPEFEYTLEFENKALDPLVFLSDTIMGFLHASKSEKCDVSAPRLHPL